MKGRKKLLGDYIDILPGFAFKTKDFLDEGVPIVKIKNITPPNVSLEDLTYVSNEIAQKSEKFMLSYNDVLIAMTGSHINQWASVVGRVARVKYKEKSLLNQRVGKIIVKDQKKANIDYIYYFLQQDETKVMLANQAGGAANQANISPLMIKRLEFPAPDIEVQNKIADILSAYDELIENNQKQIKLLEEAAQRLYKEWFVDLRFPGYEQTKIIDGVPEGWENIKVGDLLCKIKKIKQVPTKCYQKAGCIPIIDQSKDYIAGFTNDNECLVKVEKVPYIVFGDHTRVLKYINFSFAKGADGTQLIMSNNQERMPQSLLYCSLINVDLSNYHYARHFKYLKEEKILVPSEYVAKKYDEIVSLMYTNIKNYGKQIHNLTEARDRLLPKLMSGEIEV